MGWIGIRSASLALSVVGVIVARVDDGWLLVGSADVHTVVGLFVRSWTNATVVDSCI